MKKIFLILLLSLFSFTAALSDGHNITKMGFVSKDFKITKLSSIDNPENKIIKKNRKFAEILLRQFV